MGRAVLCLPFRDSFNEFLVEGHFQGAMAFYLREGECSVDLLGFCLGVDGCGAVWGVVQLSGFKGFLVWSVVGSLL